MHRLQAGVLWVAAIAAAVASAQNASLTLRVSNESAPAGGWAQIKVYADAPALIAGGVLALDLDPAVFGPIAGVAAYSPNGDAIGIANVSGTHVEASIGAPSGGIGQLPGLPVFTVRAPVLSTAQGTGFVSLSLPSTPPSYPLPAGKPYPDYAWTDPAGNPYSVTLLSGRISLFGTMSVANVTPGGGLQTAGSILHIDGGGFDASTKVSADGLAIASVQYVSPTRMDVTMGGARELTGVRFLLSNAKGERIEFFSSPTSATAMDSASNAGILHAILPFTERGSTLSAGRGETVLLLNASASAMDVLVREAGIGPTLSARTLTMAPGTLMAVTHTQSLSTVFVDASVPLRMAIFHQNNGGQGIVTAPAPDYGPPALQVYPSTSGIVIDYQIGTANPEPRTVRVSYGPNGAQDVSVQVDAGSWLKVAVRKDALFAQLDLSFDIAGLGAGKYTGTIVITPLVPVSLTGFPVQTSKVQITVNVATQPTIAVQANHTSASGVTGFDPVSIGITSNGSPAAFAIKTSTDSGGNWLSTDVSSGVTPATVNIEGDPGTLPRGLYRGHLTVQGPANTEIVDVFLFIYPMPVPALQVTPTALSVVREAGASGPFSGASLSFQPVVNPLSVTVATEDGSNWLDVMHYDIPGNPSGLVFVNVNAQDLAPGTYRGMVTGTSSNGSAQAKVTLTVVPKPTAPLTVSPASLTFTSPVGMASAPQRVTLESGDGPVLFSLEQGLAPIAVSLTGSQAPEANGQLLTPATLSVSAFSMIPGSYLSTLAFVTSYGRVTIPITVNITAGPAFPPIIASVVNAASQLPGSLAPGEIVTIRGIGVGPAPVGLQLDVQGRVSTSATPDARVLINGVAAPIVYGSVNQWNVIVPYELDGAASASLQVVAAGTASEKWTLPVAPAAPGIFTIGSTGIGRGAVLNQDTTVNAPGNPAPAGTIVQIFATGAGGASKLPVKAMLGGTEATVVFAGPAPGLVSGVLQVNAVVPRIAFGSPNLPLTIDVGGVVSQPGVTIAVR